MTRSTESRGGGPGVSVSRRGVLRALGTTVAATAGLGVLPRRVRADHDFHKPEAVTLSFDETDLEQYRPLLVTGHLGPEDQPTKQYAWRASSPDRDTDVYCYWTFWVTQAGVTGRDSHYLDRQPIYVHVASDGAIKGVDYSGWHWLAVHDNAPRTFADSAGEHPTLRVADRWHHYTRTDAEGRFVDLASLHTVFDSWLDTGWEDDLHPGAAQNPWVMRSRSSWWRDGPFGIPVDAIGKRISLQLAKLRGVPTDL